MKKYNVFTIVFLVLAGIWSGCQNLYRMDLYQKMSLSQADSTLEFSITDKEKNPRLNKRYHWFYRKQLGVSQGAYSGKLLDGPFTVFNEDKTMRVKGNYKQGLRHGVWSRWEAGQLIEQITYKRGFREGIYRLYHNGFLFESGKYRQKRPLKDYTQYQEDDLTYRINYKKEVAIDTVVMDSVKFPILRELF